MKELVCGTMWVPYISLELKLMPTPMAQSIVCTDNGEFVAGLIFDGYNGASVAMHVLIKGVPRRDWMVCIFDYPFNVLKVRKVIGQIAEDNPKSLKFATSLGFAKEASISGFFPNGAALELLTMTREQCKVLNDPRWAEGAAKVTRK